MATTNYDFKNKTVLVTGAGRGIGKAISIDFAKAGASVVLVSRTKKQLDKVASQINLNGGKAFVCPADVTDSYAVERCIEQSREQFGGVDILINNAGDNVLGEIDKVDPDSWWRQISVNIRGPFEFSRRVLPTMIDRGWGRIINISSVNGKKGSKFCTAYCSGKHGVIGFTRALALDVAQKGITVNVVCPGWVMNDLTERTFAQRAELFGMPIEKIKEFATRATPQGRSIDPGEITPTVIFLASEGASRMTGQAINVSGGSVTW